MNLESNSTTLEYTWLSEEGEPFHVVGANGQARKQEPDTPTELQPLRTASKKLKPPTLPELYEFELPPQKDAHTQPYRTGAMTARRVYRKPENLIREEYIEKHGTEPSTEVFKESVRVAHKYINRSVHGRKYEVSMAQVFYSEGLTPFIGAEHWSKDGRDSGKEQTDLYVAGLAVECKSFSSLEDYSVEEGELYLFVCSAYSFNRKSKPSDYYLLGYKKAASRACLSQTYKLGWVDLFAPVVVPVNEVELVEFEWTSPSREKEKGMFVKASEVIGFKTLVAKLKQHREVLAETSRKLSDTEVIKLLYPYLSTTGQVEKQLEREREREQLFKPVYLLDF